MDCTLCDLGQTPKSLFREAGGLANVVSRAMYECKLAFKCTRENYN